MVHLWQLLADASDAGNSLHLPARDRRIPVADVLERAERTAGDVLRALGGRSPGRLGVVMANGEPAIRGMLAAFRLDATFVPLPLPVGFAGADAYIAHLQRIVDDAALDAVLLDAGLGRAITARLGRELVRTVLVDTTEVSGLKTPGSAPVNGDDALAIVQYTSGSTSAPKGVMLTHRNVAAGLDSVRAGLQWTDEDALALWVPLFHDMGLFLMLTSLACGTPVTLWTPSDFVRRPLRWLDSFARSGATIMPAPNFCYDLLTEAARRDPPPPGLDLSRWRLGCNSAEPVRPRTLAAFDETFAPYGLRPGVVCASYGLAEVTLIVSGVYSGDPWRARHLDRDRLDAGHTVRDREPDDPAAYPVVSCGPVVPGIELRIAGEDGTPYPDGVVGEVQVTGPSITAGYLGVPATDQPFTADGWLRTGDLGFQSGGELFITGRLKDMITVRGQNYYAEDIEEIVRTTPGIDKTRCAAIAWAGASTGREDERIVVLWETALDPAGAQAVADAAGERVRQQLGLAEVDFVPVATATIPHTTSGKVRRRAALLLYLKKKEGGPPWTS